MPGLNEAKLLYHSRTGSAILTAAQMQGVSLSMFNSHNSESIQGADST